MKRFPFSFCSFLSFFLFFPGLFLLAQSPSLVEIRPRVFLSQGSSIEMKEIIELEQAILTIQQWFWERTTGTTFRLEGDPPQILHRTKGMQDSSSLEQERDSDSPDPFWQALKGDFFLAERQSPGPLYLVFSDLEHDQEGWSEESLALFSQDVLMGLMGRQSPKGREYYMGLLASHILRALSPQPLDPPSSGLRSWAFAYYPYIALSEQEFDLIQESDYFVAALPRLGPKGPQRERVFLSPQIALRKSDQEWEFLDVHEYRWRSIPEEFIRGANIGFSANGVGFSFHEESLEFWVLEKTGPRLVATLNPDILAIEEIQEQGLQSALEP